MHAITFIMHVFYVHTHHMQHICDTYNTHNIYHEYYVMYDIHAWCDMMHNDHVGVWYINIISYNIVLNMVYIIHVIYNILNNIE